MDYRYIVVSVNYTFYFISPKINSCSLCRFDNCRIIKLLPRVAVAYDLAMNTQPDPHQFTRDAWEAHAEGWDARTTIRARCVGWRFENMGFIQVSSLCNETILKRHPRSSHRQGLLYRSMPLHHCHVVWLVHAL